MSKLILKDVGFVYERSRNINVNMSGILTHLIKEAAKCTSYSSDLMIDIVPLYQALNGTEGKFVELCNSDSNENETPTVDKSSRYVRYLGFRDMGVDHLQFIVSRLSMAHGDEKTYRVIYRLSAKIDGNGNPSVSLEELGENEVRGLFFKECCS